MGYFFHFTKGKFRFKKMENPAEGWAGHPWPGPELLNSIGVL